MFSRFRQSLIGPNKAHLALISLTLKLLNMSPMSKAGRVLHVSPCTQVPFPPRTCASGGSSEKGRPIQLLPVLPHLADFFFLVLIDLTHHVYLHKNFSRHLSVHECMAPSIIFDLCSPVPLIKVELLQKRDFALYIFIVFYL